MRKLKPNPPQRGHRRRAAKGVKCGLKRAPSSQRVGDVLKRQRLAPLEARPCVSASTTVRKKRSDAAAMSFESGESV